MELMKMVHVKTILGLWPKTGKMDVGCSMDDAESERRKGTKEWCGKSTFQSFCMRMSLHCQIP